MGAIAPAHAHRGREAGRQVDVRGARTSTIRVSTAAKSKLIG